MILRDIGFCTSDDTVEDELQTLRDESRAAKVEHDAEAILLGCADFADFADELERELKILVDQAGSRP